ncbi:hypothetical protein LLG07_06115 [bacterium]|nr:hypothetical protein [bacterium]
MTELISQSIIIDSEYMNDIKISSNGNGTYEIEIGELFINFKSYKDLKRFCLNIQSEYEKYSARHIGLFDCKTPQETKNYINSQFKSILNNWAGENNTKSGEQ